MCTSIPTALPEVEGQRAAGEAARRTEETERRRSRKVTERGGVVALACSGRHVSAESGGTDGSREGLFKARSDLRGTAASAAADPPSSCRR